MVLIHKKKYWKSYLQIWLKFGKIRQILTNIPQAYTQVFIVGTLEVVIRSQEIDCRPLRSGSKFSTHKVDFGPLLSDFRLLGVYCNSNLTYVHGVFIPQMIGSLVPAEGYIS